MAYNYELTSIAETDINDTVNYIVKEKNNPVAAKKLLDDIDISIEKICKFPLLSFSCEIYGINDEKVRHMNIGNYVLIFTVDLENNNIEINRFLYGKRNISKEVI